MLTIDRSLKRLTGSNAPPPLPTVYTALADLGVHFRRGQLSMIAGAPGSCKSMIAQDHAIRAGVPTVFFSGDTDEHTMAIRAAANVTGYHQTEIAGMNEQDLDYIEGRLAERASHVSWIWEPDLSFEDIEDHVKAHALVHGDWPALIVFDVLMSYQQGSGDWNATNDFLLALKALCASTNAHVMVLHHVVGFYDDKTAAPPRGAIMNKSSQMPAQILTIGRDGDTLNVANVKCRNAPADAQALNPLKFGINASTVQITEPRKWSYSE